MEQWLAAILWYFENDPVVKIMNKIETIHLPFVPLYIFMYVSEMYVFLRAFAKTFRERACSKSYCRENRRAMMMIKFIWLVFIPLLLTTSPRRMCLLQALILTLISIALYVSALRKKASCINALMTAAVSLYTLQIYLIVTLGKSFSIFYKKITFSLSLLWKESRYYCDYL